MRIGTTLIRGIAREVIPAVERVVAHRPPPPLFRGSSVRGGFGATGVFRKPRPYEGPVQIDDEIRRFVTLRKKVDADEPKALNEMRQYLQFALTGGNRVDSPTAERWASAWLQDLNRGTYKIDEWLRQIPTDRPSYERGLRNVRQWLSYQRAVALHLREDVMAAGIPYFPQSIGRVTRLECWDLISRVDDLLSSISR